MDSCFLDSVIPSIFLTLWAAISAIILNDGVLVGKFFNPCSPCAGTFDSMGDLVSFDWTLYPSVDGKLHAFGNSLNVSSSPQGCTQCTITSSDSGRCDRPHSIVCDYDS